MDFGFELAAVAAASKLFAAGAGKSSYCSPIPKSACIAAVAELTVIGKRPPWDPWGCGQGGSIVLTGIMLCWLLLMLYTGSGRFKTLNRLDSGAASVPPPIASHNLRMVGSSTENHRYSIWPGGQHSAAIACCQMSERPARRARSMLCQIKASSRAEIRARSGRFSSWTAWRIRSPIGVL